VLVTAVHVEGQLRGPDLDLVDAVVARSAAPIIASGGIRDLDDLRELQRRGAAAAVIGMALYAGSLDARRVSEEFGG
jgi:phosphoribosylformimino-5-aminoimidazole carboxamide ribonucleotide (ProFAR) isomerase